MSAVLDEVLPAYRHRERHATRIAAVPETVWAALHALAFGDLRLTRVLMSIRTLPAPADRGFLEAFLARGYRELRVDPPWTLVAGAAAQSWRLRGGETPT